MINSNVIRNHVEVNAKDNGGSWNEYDNVILELTDAQLVAAAQKNPTLAQAIATSTANIDLPGMDYAIQAFVLRAAEMHGITYDVYALVSNSALKN